MAENENMSSKQLENSDEPSVTSSPVNTDADAVETPAQSRHDLVKKTSLCIYYDSKTLATL